MFVFYSLEPQIPPLGWVYSILCLMKVANRFFRPAGTTTTAANAESAASSQSDAHQIHATAEHVKGVAEHAASTAHVCWNTDIFFLPNVKIIFFSRLKVPASLANHPMLSLN